MTEFTDFGEQVYDFLTTEPAFTWQHLHKVRC